MESIRALRFLALVVGGLWIAAGPTGCAKLRSAALAPSARDRVAPQQLVIVCRPKVLEMQDGSRSPGVVAQAFLMGGRSMGPVVAPPGDFHFTAWQPSPSGGPIHQAPESWTFAAAEAPRHLIDHALGPCYAFWLPSQAADASHRPLVIQGRFDFEGARLEASPVKVLLPTR